MSINFDRNRSWTSHQPSTSNAGVDTNFYQRLNQLSNTIISIQYNRDQLLSFRIKNVQQGKITYDDVQGTGLLCWINKKAYFFTRQHLEQMSDREQSELFDHLGIDGSQIFVS